jgi:hypothetical protein
MAKMEDIKKTLEEGLGLAREGFAYAAERAEDLSMAAALRLRLFGLRRRIERHYAELGAAVYFLLEREGDVRADAAVKKHAKEIGALETEVNRLFARLADLSPKASLGKGRPARGQAKKTGAAGPGRPRKTGR